MRFTTIWSLRGLPLRERLRRTRDWAALEVGMRLPRRIRYWVTVREIAKATLNSPNVPATGVDYVMQHLDRPKDLA